jgi:hypothetical protein
MNIPKDYIEWKKCIEIDCQIPLTAEFITSRLSSLRNESEQSTKKLIELYGMAHLQRLVEWFSRAHEELLLTKD